MGYFWVLYVTDNLTHYTFRHDNKIACPLWSAIHMCGERFQTNTYHSYWRAETTAQTWWFQSQIALMTIMEWCLLLRLWSHIPFSHAHIYTHATTNTHWPFTAPDRAPAISQSEGSRPSPRPHCTQSCPVGIIQSSGSKFTGIWWKKVPEVMSWGDREETEKRNTSHLSLSAPRLDVVGHKIFHNSASHYPRSVYMCECVLASDWSQFSAALSYQLSDLTTLRPD